MNVHASADSPVPTTRAAEGFGRRAFTVAEILAMQDSGIFGPDENFELIEGEIVPMNAKLHIHERTKSKMVMALARYCPAHLIVGIETSIFLGEKTFLEPDICIYPENMPSDQVEGTDLVVAIEVAVSTLTYDLGLKPKIYARYGVREYWVIDAVQRRTFIHTGPTGDTWTSIAEHGPEFELTIAAVPGFRQRLADI